MKKIYITIAVIAISCMATAQVGIGTAAPTADLEIIAQSPPGSGEYNGIIIPKVSVLPTGADLPGASQAGLILYLDSNDTAEGFYFFNGVSYQNVNASSNFFNTGTSDISNNTTDVIYRTGRINIGEDGVNGVLTSTLTATAVNGTRSPGFFINNDEDSGSEVDYDTYGLRTENNSLNGAGATEIKYGISSKVSGDGTAERIGLNNEVIHVNGGTGTTNTTGLRNYMNFVRGSGTTYGVNNFLNIRGAQSGDVYSLYSNIINGDGGTGARYGVYSVMDDTGSNPGYSGWFQGPSFAIRNPDASDGYDLPTTSGTAGQVLTANGVNGLTTWTTLPTTAIDDIVRANLASTVSISSIATNTTDYHTLDFNDESIDTNNSFDTATFAFTPSTDGIYDIYAQYHTEGEDNLGIYGIAIYVNSTIVSLSEYQHTGNVFGSSANGIVKRSINDIVQLTTSDTVTIRVRVDDNTSNNFDGSAAKTFMTVKKI